MHARGCVSQFIDINKEVACSARDSDKYLLTNSSPDRVSPSIILITPIGPLLIQNKFVFIVESYGEHVTREMVVLTVRKVTRIKNCHCCNNESDSDRFSCSIPYITEHVDSCVVQIFC